MLTNSNQIVGRFMKSIKIDEDVYAYLQQKAIAFEETPNDVLRRIFGLNQLSGDILKKLNYRRS